MHDVASRKTLTGGGSNRVLIRMTLEARLIQAHVKLQFTSENEDGSKTASLGRFGAFEVQLVEPPHSSSTNGFIFWIDLIDHERHFSIDSGGTDDLEEALAAAEELLSQAQQLSGKLGLAPMISIVDDDETVREATKSLVRSLGYNAATFASAEEFLQSNILAHTSCLIADVQMPGLSGVELQSRLIAQGNGTPVIFVTAYAEERIRSRAMKAGAIGVLSKPYAKECLIKYLNAALKKRKGGSVEQ
jgi:CheY-like chemotaxis protein